MPGTVVLKDAELGSRICARVDARGGGYTNLFLLSQSLAIMAAHDVDSVLDDDGRSIVAFFVGWPRTTALKAELVLRDPRVGFALFSLRDTVPDGALPTTKWLASQDLDRGERCTSVLAPEGGKGKVVGGTVTDFRRRVMDTDPERRYMVFEPDEAQDTLGGAAIISRGEVFALTHGVTKSGKEWLAVPVSELLTTTVPEARRLLEECLVRTDTTATVVAPTPPAVVPPPPSPKPTPGPVEPMTVFKTSLVLLFALGILIILVVGGATMARSAFPELGFWEAATALTTLLVVSAVILAFYLGRVSEKGLLGFLKSIVLATTRGATGGSAKEK